MSSEAPTAAHTVKVEGLQMRGASGLGRPTLQAVVVARVQGAGVRPVPCRRPAWSVVLPGLRNAGEPALVASRGRARRARACKAKARRWRRRGAGGRGG